jgi:hypothetical protein
MTDDEFESALSQIRSGSYSVDPEEAIFMKAVQEAGKRGRTERKNASIKEQPWYERLGKSAAGAGDIAAYNVKKKLLGLSPEEEANLAGEKEYIKQAGYPGMIGSGLSEAAMLAPAAAFGGAGAIPVLGRGTLSSALSSLFAAPGQEAEQAAKGFLGQVGGEEVGALASMAMPYAKRGYEGLKGLFDAPTGAAQQLRRFSTASGEELPLTADLSRTYANVPDLHPTLGMMVPEEQKALIDLENLVRVGPGRRSLSEADIYNQQAIMKGLDERAYKPEKVTEEMSRLNELTGGLRENAYTEARKTPFARLTSPVEKAVSAVRTRPGETGYASPEAQRIASEVESRAFAKQPEKTASAIFGVQQSGGPDPKDLYAARKFIDDALRASGGANDELTNKVKQNKVVAIELKKAIDEGLSQASSGKWDEYLNTYIEKIKPIEEGKAFQGVLDLFKTAPRVPGSDLASITPLGMRKAASKATYKELGTSLKDMLSPEGRQFLDEASSAMSAIENVRKGVRAVEGSQTTPYREALTRQVTSMFPRMAGAALQGIGSEAKSQAEQLLVNAIRNPDQFQELLNVYHKMYRKPAIEATGLQKLFGTAGAVGSYQNR